MVVGVGCGFEGGVEVCWVVFVVWVEDMVYVELFVVFFEKVLYGLLEVVGVGGVVVCVEGYGVVVVIVVFEFG